MANADLRIILGADSLLGPRSGIGRMTLEIARTMHTHPDIADFVLMMHDKVYPQSWLATLDDIAETASRTPRRFTKETVALAKRFLGLYLPGVSSLHHMKRRFAMRRELRQFNGKLASATTLPLVYHEPNMILAPFDGLCVATLNDLSWHHDPKFHPAERIRWIGRNLPRTLARANRFIAISAFTRDEAVRLLGVPEDRIDVVHLAPSSVFQPMAAAEAAPMLSQFGLHDQRYVLSVSTLEPRKNFDRLLTAYLGLPAALRERTPMVIVGGKGWGTVLARSDATRAVAAGQLRTLGHLPDETLAALTSRCAVFAYVSLYEGFGLPVVEAMATGAAVLASATTATGEVAGEGAVLVDPLDVDAIRNELRVLLEEPETRASWASKSLQRAADFSWLQTVDGMARTWRRVAVGDPATTPKQEQASDGTGVAGDHDT